MNTSRVDAELRQALGASHPHNDRLSVQIETDHELTTAEAGILASYGVPRPGAFTRLFSAKLTKTEIDSISEQPWLRCVSLAKRPKRS